MSVLLCYGSARMVWRRIACVLGRHELSVAELTELLGLAQSRVSTQLARLRSDPELDGGAVEELLRFDSPVQFSRRITTAELEVDGKTVPAGMLGLTAVRTCTVSPVWRRTGFWLLL